MLNPPTTTEEITLRLDNEEIREQARDSICQSSSIAAYLNKLADDFYAQDKSNPDRQRQKERTERLRRYLCSDHNGKITEDGEYNDLSGVGDEYFFDPKLNTYFATVMPQLLQAQTRLFVKPKTNEIKFRRVAEFLQKEFETWLTNARTINKRQREIKWNLLPAGDTYRHLFMNDKKIVRIIDAPVTTEKQITKGGKWTCPNCQASGAIADLNVKDHPETVICPQCQFAAAKVKQTVVSFEEAEDFAPTPLCEIDFEVPDSSEITVIWTSDEISEALAVIWTRSLPRCLVQEAFPGKAIPTDNVSRDPDYISQNTSTPETNTQNIRVQRIWLNPSVYRNFRTEKGEPLAIGEDKIIDVPSNAAILKEVFREGLYYIRAGAKTILQTYEQGIGDVWTHSVNEIGPSGYGIGEWDMVELQYQKNEARTQRMQKLLNDSIEPIVEREGYIDDFPNQHGARIKVRDVPLNVRLDNIVTRTPAAKFPAEATEMERQVDGDMQARLGAMSTGSADLPDMNAVKGTATGFQIYQNHTIERRRPLLQMMADNLDCKMFFQYWKAFKDFQSRAAAEAYFDKYPAEIIEWFFEMDIRRDFDVTVVPNSFMPKTTEQKQYEFVNRFNIASSLYAGNAEKMNELTREFEQVFGGNILDEQSAEQTEAQLRLEKVIEAAKRVEEGRKRAGGGVADANGFVDLGLVNVALVQATKITKTLQTLADPFPNMPVDVLLDEHEEFIDVYQDYLRSSNGRLLSQFVRAVIKALIAVHSQATAQKEIYIQSLFNQVTAAQAEFQRGEQMKNQETQLEMQTNQAMTQMGIGQLQNQMSQEAGETEMMNELATQGAKNQMELQHNEAKGNQQIGLEAAKQSLRDDYPTE